MTEPSTAAPSRFTGLWRHSDFLKLWLGQTISELGSRITRDGLPLAAVLVLGATPAQMGVLIAFGSAVVLLTSLPSGVWVDRLRRRPIMIAADIGRALLLLTIPIAALSGHLQIGLLFIVIASTGALTVLFDAAYSAYLPSLIERANLFEGNSKLALSSSLAEVLGPGLAGLLIQLLTAPLAIFFDALSFVASVVSLIFIHKPEPAPPPIEGRQHLAREMIAGMHFVWREPHLRAIALTGSTRSFFGSFIGVLYGLFAIRELGLGAAALGVTISMGGLGSLIGALLAERIVKRYTVGGTIIGTALTGGFLTLFIPLAGGSVTEAVMVLVIVQLFGDALHTIYDITVISVQQSITPDQMLGRANTSMQVLVAGIAPIGASAGGLLAEALGVRVTLLIAAGGIVLSSGWVIFSPVRYLRDRPERAKIEEISS